MRLFIILSMMFCSFSAQAQSGGGKVGNGGDVVVCFDVGNIVHKFGRERILKDFIDSTGRITDGAWEKVISIQTLDYYQAQLPRGINNPQRTELVELNGLSYENAKNAIKENAKKVPEFYQKWNEVEDFFTADRWASVNTRLVDVNDANVGYDMPWNCILYQAAMFQNGNIFYDGNVFNHAAMPQAMVALEVAHEELFYIARGRDQEDSANVRNITYYLLKKDVSDEELRNKLIEFGFGNYSSISQLNSEIGELRLMMGVDFETVCHPGHGININKWVFLRLQRNDPLDDVFNDIILIFKKTLINVQRNDSPTSWYHHEIDRVIKEYQTAFAKYQYHHTLPVRDIGKERQGIDDIVHCKTTLDALVWYLDDTP